MPAWASPGHSGLADAIQTRKAQHQVGHDDDAPRVTLRSGG
jgi:hypothetical protein